MDEEESTSNVFLISMLALFPWSEEHGVFSSDRIPSELASKPQFSIICNLSRSGQAGTHFIAIIRRGEIILYLDPLALYIELNEDISNFISKCNVEKVSKMSQAIQHPKSSYCAYFCLLLLLHFNPEITAVGTEKFSNKNLKINDCICINNIAKYIDQNYLKFIPVLIRAAILIMKSA
jgi:hypothetical protein